MHAILEAWSRDGKAPDLDEVFVTSDGKKHRPGRIAAAGLRYLPKHSLEHQVEQRIDIDFGWAKFVGYIDLLYGYRVYDHKTTSDFKWMKNSDELRNDIQSAIYAAHVLSYSGYVDLKWTYFRTKGASTAKQVSIRYTNEDLNKTLERIKLLSLEIYDHYKNKPEVLSLEPNVNQCDAYGGCPYRDKCDLSPRERLKGLMAQESLRDKMKRRLAEQKAAAQAETPAQTQETSKVEKQSLKEKLAARKAQGVNPPEAPSTVVQPPTVEQVMSDSSLVAPQKTGYTLYVDCYPISNGARPTHAAEILGSGASAVASELDLPHYRMAGYAKGPAALAVWLEEHLGNNAYGEIFIDSNTTEARDTLTVFENHATTIVRGL